MFFFLLPISTLADIPKIWFWLHFDIDIFCRPLDVFFFFLLMNLPFLEGFICLAYNFIE